MSISRRRFLEGLGVCLALPFLESLSLPLALAGRKWTLTLPQRSLFISVPNGIHMPAWTPAAFGSTYDLSATLEPLAALRSRLTILTGLDNRNAQPLGDGPGDHARSAAALLTGAHPLKSGGSELRAGVSIDQLISQRLGAPTRFSSLELGLEGGPTQGSCDSGYACAYGQNNSWSSPSTPRTKETDPRQLFERLFSSNRPGETDAHRLKRIAYKKSVLDFVQEDAKSLQASLGVSDRAKLDEYLSSVRELELRLDGTTPACDIPVGIPGSPQSYPERVKLFCDLIVLAVRCDLTRTVTFMLANEGSGQSYPFIGVPDGHHAISHHGGSSELQAKLALINHWHISQLGYLAEQLAKISEGPSDLLQNTLIYYGSGIADGNDHGHLNLPTLLVGNGGGAVKPGRHIQFAAGTPLANLWVSMAQARGVSLTQFADSTGALAGLG